MTLLVQLSDDKMQQYEQFLYGNLCDYIMLWLVLNVQCSKMMTFILVYRNEIDNTSIMTFVCPAVLHVQFICNEHEHEARLYLGMCLMFISCAAILADWPT